MSEDIFFPLFLERVGGAIRSITPSGRRAIHVYGGLWREFSGREEAGRYAVADGSWASASFRGGVDVAVIRAASQIYDNLMFIDRVYDLTVKAGRLLRRLSLYAKALEYKCLLESMKRGVGMLICDGSIYPTIHPAVLMWPEQSVEALVEYLSSLASLIREAEERGVVLIGLSKDSAVNYVRAKALGQLILKEHPEEEAAVARERSPRRLAEFLRKRGIVNEVVEELEVPTSDEEAFEENAVKPGFSKPLALAPQPIFFSEEIAAGTRCWAEAKIRERLSSAKHFKAVAGLLDEIYSGSPIVTVYWRPWHGVGVYRLDVAGWSLGVQLKSSEMSGDEFLGSSAEEKCKEIIAKLNFLSMDGDAVTPLFKHVDAEVKLSTHVFRSCYERIIREELQKAGFKAHLPKRRMREIELGGG